MNVWLCPYKETCPFLEKAFCGHNKEKPVLLSYHPETPTATECYVGHVINCWNQWLKLREKWSNSVKRVVESVTGVRIDERNFQEALGLVILHHDLGKLTNEYQNKEFFRHEILSSFMLYNQLRQDHSKTDLLAAIFAAAVYLHHEGLQISHEYFELREPTYSYLINWLSSREFHMVSNWDELFYQINRQYLLLSMRPVSLNQKVIKGLEVANTLGSLLVTVDGFPEPLAMRMAIATVLHPLTICDNRAASVRGGIPSIISRTLAKFFDEGVPTGEEE